MKVEEIIASGALELYAMQALEKAEMEEISVLLSAHPQLRAELDLIEQSLQKLAESGSVQPSPNLLNTIEQRIAHEEKEESTKVIPLSAGRAPIDKPKLNMWGMAASVLLLCSVGANLYFLNQNKKLSNLNAQLTSEKTLMAQNNTVLYQNNQETLAMLNDMAAPAASKLQMGGTAAFPQHKANVIYNEASHQTYMLSAALPELSKDEQYQLWALVDGKPVDLGVFDAKNEVIKLKSLDTKPQAFAVTIEKRGGQPTPTLSAMCLYAEYKSS